MKIWQEDGESIPHIKFSTNGTEPGYTEITSISNYFKYGIDYGLTEAEVVTYSLDEVTDWATHLQSDKDLIIAFVEANRFVAAIPTEVRNDLTAPYKGYKIFNTTTVQPEWYNGTAWVSTGASGGVGKICIPAEAIGTNNATRSILSSNSQTYLSFSGVGAVDDAGTTFIIPEDYASGLKFYAVWIMDGSSTDQARLALNIVQATDLSGKHNDAASETLEILDNCQNVAAWTNQVTPKVSSGLTWTPGETCILEIERDPGHVNDTANDTLYLSALIIEYTKQ